MIDKQKNQIKTWLGTGSVNLFGMPFAGKDTQGKRLAKRLDGAFISSGDILRHHSLSAPDKLALDHGDLLPVQDYLQLITPYLSLPEFQGKPLVLSAVGHRSGEAEVILDVTARVGHPIKAVIYLHIDESVAKSRWRHLASQDDRHRTDDKPGVLEHRLDEYHEMTLPILEFYREHKLLIEIDGYGTPEAVETAILVALYTKSIEEN